jgi:archaemetzincin
VVVCACVNRTARLALACAATIAACQGEVAAKRTAGSTAEPGGAPSRAEPPDPFAFDPRFFEKQHEPGPSDWLAAHPEPGQTFAAYTAQPPLGRTSRRHVIVLQPIGPFTPDERAVLDQLREFASAFFQLPVRVEPPIPLPEQGKRTRLRGLQPWTQYHTGALMEEVLLPRLPRDAVCILGITMADLYPASSWNFVFGEASFSHRVGVYSLVRYTERFWGKPETAESRHRFLERSFKLLAHETLHMFSLAHCTAYECLMNGTNSLDETDRSTIHLCPECLHKLQWNLKLDVQKHYRQLGDIYTRSGYPELADWIHRRLASLAPR